MSSEIRQSFAVILQDSTHAQRIEGSVFAHFDEWSSPLHCKHLSKCLFGKFFF